MKNLTELKELTDRLNNLLLENVELIEKRNHLLSENNRLEKILSENDLVTTESHLQG